MIFMALPAVNLICALPVAALLPLRELPSPVTCLYALAYASLEFVVRLPAVIVSLLPAENTRSAVAFAVLLSLRILPVPVLTL